MEASPVSRTDVKSQHYLKDSSSAGTRTSIRHLWSNEEQTEIDVTNKSMDKSIFQIPAFYRLTNFRPIPPLQKYFSTNSNQRLPIPPNFTQHRALVSLSSLFQRYGFRSSDLRDFLKNNQFLLTCSHSEIENSLKILLSMKSSQEFLVSIVASCPRVLDFKFLKKWESSISELGVSGITSAAIQNILEVSRKFNLEPHDLSACIKRLKGLGFKDDTVIRVLEAFPVVILMSEDRIRDRIGSLIGIGIEKHNIDRIFNVFPGILASGFENKMRPLLTEFHALGFSLDLVRKEILRDPQVLGLEIGELSKCLRMLRSLTCRVPIKEKIFSQGSFRAGYNVKLRIDFLHRHGLTYRDAFTVLWKEPRAILYDIEEIEKKIEFLLHRMKTDILWLVEVPQYLGVSFEKQIVPRYKVIEFLRSKGGLGDEVYLKDLIKTSRLRFYNLYVKPYPECENIYGKFKEDIEAGNRHPVGMWKLFRPQKYSKSEEDVKNVKSFMESFH